MTQLRSAILIFLLLPSLAAADSRVSSDFELQAALKQIRNARDSMSKVAAHLNLGDVRRSRGEMDAATLEYGDAAALASREAAASRNGGDLNRYAQLTAWAGLAVAKLGRLAEAADAFEEATRYLSDSPAIWNLYASAMTILGRTDRAISFARNAVSLSAPNRAAGPSGLLDSNVYRYALASALLQEDRSAASDEAESILTEIDRSLDAPPFQSLKDEIARTETFEIFSTTRGDAASFLSLWNRAHLRLGSLEEARGHNEQARMAFRKVLTLRTDDPQALQSMARLATSASQRERYYAAAFAADPLSLSLVEEFRRALDKEALAAAAGDTTGARMQRAIIAAHGDRISESNKLLLNLAKQFPGSVTLQYLLARNAAVLGDMEPARGLVGDKRLPDTARRELESAVSNAADRSSRAVALLAASAVGSARSVDAADLRSLLLLLQSEAITPGERVRLDTLDFQSSVQFDAVTARDQASTTFRAGSIGTVPFLFSSPVRFAGQFDASALLNLEYHILGMTEVDGRESVLLEPLRLTRQGR